MEKNTDFRAGVRDLLRTGVDASGKKIKPAPKTRKPRGVPYNCERCQSEHVPTSEPLRLPGETLTEAEHERSRAAYIYKAHKVYAADTERARAIKELRAIVTPGDTLHTILRHKSRSGMMRHISVIHKGVDITWLVARAEGVRRCDDGGIKAGGCGMDMGFAVVYNLSSLLYAGGFECTGTGGAGDDPRAGRCPSNDHSNGDRDYTPHLHKSGGYALRQAWL